jgi:hypothetical protein
VPIATLSPGKGLAQIYQNRALNWAIKHPQFIVMRSEIPIDFMMCELQEIIQSDFPAL